MKERLIIILSLLISTTIFAQIDVSFFDEADVGKCFIATPTDTLSSQTLYLEIVPPVYQTFSIRTDDELIFDVFDIDLSDSKPTLVEITPIAHTVVKRKTDRRCSPDLNCFERKNSFVFCKTETPAKYKALEKVMTIRNGDTLMILKPQKIEYQKITANGKLRITTVQEATATSNEIFAVNLQNWSDWRELLCPTCGGGNKISELQQKLNQHGYDLVIDGVLDSKTRAAIIDFQEKNDLPTGRLDLKTLRLLGFNIDDDCP